MPSRTKGFPARRLTPRFLSARCDSSVGPPYMPVRTHALQHEAGDPTHQRPHDRTAYKTDELPLDHFDMGVWAIEYRTGATAVGLPGH